MKKRDSEEERLTDVVDKFLSNYGLKKRFQDQEIINLFTKQMGPFLMKKVKYVYIKDRRLILHLTSAPFKNEMQLQKSKLIDELNQKIGHQYLIDLVLK